MNAPQGCVCKRYLSVLGALVAVSGVEHLKATHITDVAVEIGTVDSVAALSDSGVRTELLPQLLVVLCRVAVELLDERAGALPVHLLSWTRATQHY